MDAKHVLWLRHKNLNWKGVTPPDGYGSRAYCQIIPAGTIPAIDDGGFKLCDSEAIAEYINEIAPTPAMLPTDVKKRAIARSISRFPRHPDRAFAARVF